MRTTRGHHVHPPVGPRRVRAVAVGIVLLLVGAACGSTASTDPAPDEVAVGEEPRSTSEAEGGADQPAGPDGDAAAPGGEPAAEVAQPTPTGADPGQPAPTAPAEPDSQAGTDGEPEAEPRAAAAAPIETGKGVSDTSILLGIPYADTNSANAGMAALTGTDNWADEEENRQKAIQAVIDHVNAEGGIQGRSIEPIWYSINAAEYLTGREGRAREVQRMCAKFTEDNQVFAIMPVRGNVPDDLIYDCAVQKQTPFIGTTFGFAPVDQQRYAEIRDYYYYVDGMMAERRERNYARELVARGYFEEGARVGLMTDGAIPAIGRAVESVLKPELAAAGVEIASEVVYPDWIDSPWQSYVLQFQRAGVTHVIWSSASGLSFPAVFFMRAAESQQFRPRYGLASDLSPAGITDLAPPEQLAGAVAVGWAPNDEDLNEDQRRERGPISPADATCYEIAESSGQGYQRGACQGFFWLQHALNDATALTVRGLADAVARMGASAPRVSTFELRFAPGRPDGAELIRYLEYDPGCNCFAYVGEPHVP